MKRLVLGITRSFLQALSEVSVVRLSSSSLDIYQKKQLVCLTVSAVINCAADCSSFTYLSFLDASSAVSQGRTSQVEREHLGYFSS